VSNPVVHSRALTLGNTVVGEKGKAWPCLTLQSMGLTDAHTTLTSTLSALAWGIVHCTDSSTSGPPKRLKAMACMVAMARLQREYGRLESELSVQGHELEGVTMYRREIGDGSSLSAASPPDDPAPSCLKNDELS
jgi:hypothetical protein